MLDWIYHGRISYLCPSTMLHKRAQKEMRTTKVREELHVHPYKKKPVVTLLCKPGISVGSVAIKKKSSQVLMEITGSKAT